MTEAGQCNVKAALGSFWRSSEKAVVRECGVIALNQFFIPGGLSLAHTGCIYGGKAIVHIRCRAVPISFTLTKHRVPKNTY